MKTYTNKSNAKRAAKNIAAKFDVVKEVKTVESAPGVFVNICVVSCTPEQLPEKLVPLAHQFISECAKPTGVTIASHYNAVAQPSPAKASKATGIKIQKDREERNGIKRPSAGGKCAQLWDLFQKHYDETGFILTPKPARELSAKQGLDPVTTSVQLYRWRAFMGW